MTLSIMTLSIMTLSMPIKSDTVLPSEYDSQYKTAFSSNGKEATLNRALEASHVPVKS